MPSPLTVIYEFDRFRLDRGNHRLTRDGLLLNTPGRTFPLLLTLIENREQVLSVDKLVNSFFPKSPFGEEELSAEILQLKRLLDDTSKNAPLVRTLAGKGYQFEAEVTEYLGDSSGSGQMGGGRSSASAPAEEYRPPAKKSSVMLGIGIAAAVVAVLAVAGWFFFMRPHGGSSSGDGSSFSSSIYDGTPHVAVLPFQSLTGAAGDDQFNRSLTEAIIASLGKNSHLDVVPEDSVRHYLESGPADPVTAGRQLGAQLIVRGMAQRLAGKIVVKVQLLSADDGSQIWSNAFDGDSKDLAGMSTKISEKIGKGIPSADGNPQ